jgi:hypothetical protein
MGQLNDAISSIAVIILMHLFRDSVDKAKFWLYAERVTLTRQQVANILRVRWRYLFHVINRAS